MFGKVYGPYTLPNKNDDIFIFIYNENGLFLERKILTYSKYIEEYDNGMHRYREPMNFIEYNKLKINMVCKKIKKYDKNSIVYYKQYVIPIKRINKEDWYIIFDKNSVERRSVFINKNMCSLFISSDINGIVRCQLVYDIRNTVVIKPVRGFKKIFWITAQGDIISRRTKKELIKNINKRGYVNISSRINGRKGKCICCKIHRLVAKTYIPNPLNKPDVNHINGIKTDNRVENLEWCTAKENMRHAVNTGLIIPKQGCDVHCAKLNEEQVKEIRSIKKVNWRKIAKYYNVSHRAILDVRNRKTYRFIDY